MALAYYEILKGGGFSTGGTNFDAKLRRQSIDLSDLVMAHAGAMDCCARGLKAAAAMIEDRPLIDFVENRYAGWSDALAEEVSADAASLADIRTIVKERDINPKPVTGRQEHLENVVNRYV